MDALSQNQFIHKMVYDMLQNEKIVQKEDIHKMVYDILQNELNKKEEIVQKEDIHKMVYDILLQKEEKTNYIYDQNLLLTTEINTINDKSQQNTIIGLGAGYKLQGNNNILIGYKASPTLLSSSNEIVLGNSNINALRCQQTSIAGLSDIRDKTNINELKGDEILSFLNKIKPVTFQWDKREWYENGISDGTKKGTYDTGFIAQQILECKPLDIYNLVYTLNKDKYEVAPGRFIPLLVSAIKELDDKINKLYDLIKK